MSQSPPRKPARKEDRCLVTRLYALATPYLQLVGWAFIAVPFVILVATLIPKAEAFDSRLTATEQNYILLNQKVDLLLEFWRVPGREEFRK